MKKGFLIVLLVAISIFYILSSVSASDITSDVSDNHLNVTTDLSQALDDSKIQNKNVLLIFDQDYCTYCEMLKQSTLSNATVIDELNNRFIIVMLNINEKSDVASNYEVYGTPEMIIVDSNANELHRIVGYVSADELLNEIKEI